MRRVFLVLAVMALLTLSAMPAIADHRGENGGGAQLQRLLGTQQLYVLQLVPKLVMAPRVGMGLLVL